MDQPEMEMAGFLFYLFHSALLVLAGRQDFPLLATAVLTPRCHIKEYVIQICFRVAEERLLCVICQAQEVKSHSGLSVSIHFCFHTQRTNCVLISLIDVDVAQTS